jgi:hypothetical protein
MSKMKFWHFNTHSPNNGDYMIRNKRAHIGLGNDDEDYQNRKKNKFSNFYQYQRCEDNIKKGDIIVLYQNGTGYLCFGIFTGDIYKNKLDDKLPNWSDTEISFGFVVNKWFSFKETTKERYPLRGTLLEIKKFEKIINYITKNNLLIELFRNL